MEYFWLTVRHKFFVFLAGLKVGTPLWRLITHDFSKFSPQELPHYQRQFFGAKDDPAGFIACWVHHQNRNDHHWEYWIPRTGHNRCAPPYPDGEPIPMPDGALREMIADWLGAGRAYNGKWPDKTWHWLNENIQHIRLHPQTLESLREIVKSLGYVVRW